MRFTKKITKLFNNAETIEFDNKSKFVIMSDCHRGDGGLSDGFSRNQDIYFFALNYYYNNEFTYMELGDGDELWENKKASDIIETYSNIFWLLSEFRKKNRLYCIFGNHDMVKKDQKYVNDNFSSFFDTSIREYMPLFNDMKFYEALVLKYKGTENKILLLHGHQGDFFNEKVWKFTRFLVRYVWSTLEKYGVNDPTSTAKNHKKKRIVEKKFSLWIKENKHLVITGHTHRPMFPEIGETPYFNDGSCVHPRCITAIEIKDGNIELVKWCIAARQDGVLYIKRTSLEGPRNINSYFEKFK